MSRTIAACAGILTILAAAGASLVTTVGARAGRDARPVGSLAFHLYGPVVTEPSGCTVVDVVQKKDKKVGDGRTCLDSITGGPAGDTVTTDHLTLAVQAGRLSATGVGHAGAVTPFTTGPLALPSELAGPGDQWFAFAEDAVITGGTKAYENARGSIRIFGVYVLGDEGVIWENATAVVELG